MPDPVSPASGPPAADERLESWKDIAQYLGREVRTVQLWEKNEGLPVHRHFHSRQGSVYAFRRELDAWRHSRAASHEPQAAAIDPAAPGVLGMTNGPEPPLLAGSKKPLLWIAATLALLVAAAATYIWHARRSLPTGPNAVVVLPFLDMSPAKDQEYFSDGLTEEIIDALSRVPKLHVVARTSAFAYKGKNTDIRKIGEQLNVDAVLEGSVRKDGNQLRITAQLNRVSDGFHYWSKTFDRPLKDVFGVQREISQAIANQLRAGEVASHQPTKDLEAYRLYEEGRYFFNQFTAAEFHKAIDRYQQAITLDPQFALAFAGLADAYSYLAEFGIERPNEVMPKARQAAERAVLLDASSGEAHTALGLVRLDYEWNRPAAEQEFLRAAELNPSSSWTHHWLAHLRETQLRLDDAMAEFRAAAALDPLSEPLHWDLATDLMVAGRYPEAITTLEQAHELFPGEPLYMASLTRAKFAAGDIAGAQAAINALTSTPAAAAAIDQLQPGFVTAWRGLVAARLGRRQEGEAALRRLEALRQRVVFDPVTALDLCFGLADRACAGLWVKRMHDEHSALFVYTPLYYRNQLPMVPEAAQLLAEIR